MMNIINSEFDKIKYCFEAENLEDYKLVLLLFVSNKLFNEIFSRTRKVLIKKGGVFETLKDDKQNITEGVKGFEIPSQYYNYLKISLSKELRKVKAAVEADKIKVLSYYVERAAFIKDDDLSAWRVIIVFKGLYQDLRGT